MRLGLDRDQTVAPGQQHKKGEGQLEYRAHEIGNELISHGFLFVVDALARGQYLAFFPQAVLRGYDVMAPDE